MSVPLQISFRDMESSPTVESHIREHADRLERFHQRIMSCHVVIHAPHRHHHKGRIYHVSIDVTVPGHEIAVNRDPPAHHAHEDIEVAVRDAFDAVARRLEDVARRSRGDVKSHETEPHGRVARLFADEGYGFIATPDEGDIYFHENSVANGAFRRLKVGGRGALSGHTRGERSPGHRREAGRQASARFLGHRSARAAADRSGHV